MKSLLLKLLVLLPSTLAWVAPRHAPTAPAWIARHRPSTTALRMSDQEEGSDSPCWQDLYADDCTMENIAAAGFIASKWIQSMPCGAGIEDCDMPESLTTPEIREGGGVDDVDVMDLLGLKRAEGLVGKKKSDKEELSP